jgi:hypothetical protein
MSESCFKDGGLPRVLSEQCATCIYRPGNPMKLKEGRLQSLTADAVADGQGVICHDTLSYGPFPDYGGAICRGFYDSYGHLNNFIRIMGRLGGFEEVDPPHV